MDTETEINRNDIVTYWGEAGYHIVVNSDAGEDSDGRSLITIRKIMTSKLLKRMGKHTYDVCKDYVHLNTREDMLELIAKGRKRFDDAEKLIREFQV